MHQNDFYWLAGLLEGEGSFLLRSGRVPVVQCGMTDEDIIRRIEILVGGSVYFQQSKNPKHKDHWVWQLRGPKAVELMQVLKPLMGSRRQIQIGAALHQLKDYQDSIIETRDDKVKKYYRAGQDYLDGKGSLREIARRYGMSQVTVLNYKRLLQHSGVA